MPTKIYLSSPHMSDEKYEQQYIKEAFDTNWIAPLGENVNQFEKELSHYVGAKYGSALSSGTAAIHLALKAANIKKGDIVICSTLTFSATVNPIIYEGAIPVFVDSDLESWNMDPKLLEKALTKYPKAKAVILVHIYGLSAKLDEITQICKKHKITLIEDAAESLGTTYKGKQTGTFGEYGIYSFNGNKIITTSGGGMIVSNNEEKIAKSRFWATQSRENTRHYEHKEIGYNYRMSNILAGIGRGQLKILNQRIHKKQYILKYYKKALKDTKNIEFMPINTWNNPNCWLSVITLKDKTKPTKIIEALEKNNIEARPVWKPMHTQSIFKNYDHIGGQISEYLFEHGLCLPSDTKMTDQELEKICSIIKGAVK